LQRSGSLLRFELSSNPEILCVARSVVMRLSEEMGFAPADCRALTRAVDEALANIIRHAYGGRPGRPIEIVFRRIRHRIGGKPRAGIQIVLIDQGPAVDRKKLCGRSLDDIRPGGLGLHFIESGVDAVKYTREGRKNELRLVKYLPTGDRG
jgi:anti-sigma regulatory factor (Ser/Thr protein kinase)